MKRILILGRSGSGKTTFSEKLGKTLDCKVVHLDNLFWKPGWVRAFTSTEWENKVQELISEDEWILDGNYHNTSEMRLKRADTVFLFEMKPLLSIMQALKRRFFRHSNSPDTVPGLHQEGSFILLLRSTFTFPAKKLRLQIKESGVKDVFVIKNHKDADKILKSLSNK